VPADPIDEACLRDGAIKRLRPTALFLAFNIIDGCTEGKQRDSLRCRFRQVAGLVETTFTEADIL
jgi:hypothetical protein